MNRILRTPAIQALLFQIAAFPLTLAAVYFAARAGFQPGYLHAALAQGLFAAGLTWWRGLAGWWRAIQGVFPVALLGADQLAIPPGVFLAVFLFLLLLYWSTYRTQVPDDPSGPEAWAAFEAALPTGRPLRVIDIGSGLGGLTLDLARGHPDWVVTGIELAPLPWLVSRLRAIGTRSRFMRGDYAALKFSDFDAVFAYLSPAAMPALWSKAVREMRPGSVLFSYEFVIAERPPSRIVTPYKEGAKLYQWDF